MKNSLLQIIADLLKPKSLWLVATEPVWGPLPSLFNQQKIESLSYSNKTVTLTVTTAINYSIFHLVWYLASTVKYNLNLLTFPS